MRKRPAQRRALATFDTLLDATAQLLNEIEFDDLNTNRIADRAGYSIGTLYAYFPDKQALVRALALREIQRSGEKLDQLIAQHQADSVEPLVRALARTMIAFFAGRTALRRRVIVVVGLDATLHKEIEVLVERMTDRLLDAVRANRDAIYPERRFLLLRTMLWPVRLATLQAPHLLQSPAFENELVTSTTALLLPWIGTAGGQGS
ncbi:TetR/AcrR family transcriptional regulator [Sphingomonas sp. 37zxx]|uniref:TetR/AcrR family transcriptional regulator n=1 Tax=Sphingomonas sp. 37zxx TaxID=1550073 RepID=UPI00068BE466|nr:TetR/AcrR family transcriptional regulator [Sphingomonas sp. 37zxx]